MLYPAGLRPRPALLATLSALALSATLAPDPARADPAAPRLERQTVPADSRQQTVLTVPRFGRYAIEASSAQGVGLQLVDRMEGPGAIMGAPGEADGRIDAFLEQGDYLIVTHPAEKAAGEVKLTAARSAELNDSPLRLEPDRLMATTLTDHHHRSWWIDLEKDRIVAFEAAGRHLADLRLWRDGNWLVEGEPTCGTIEPVTGQPVRRCTLTRQLPAGLYRLSAYGGPGSAWAEAGEQKTLHVRWGVTRIPGDGGRAQRVIGPFGVDRFRLDGSAREIGLSLPGPAEKGDVELSVAAYDPARPFAGGGFSDRITKESRVPTARVRVSVAKENVVTVSGPPGQPYTVQWFAPIGIEHVLGGEGPYYIATLHDGPPGDRMSASAFFTRGDGEEREVVDQTAIPLRTDRRYSRRFNLTGWSTIFLDVQQPGDFEFTAAGAELRIEPAIERPEDYETPEWSPGGVGLGLPTGLHVLQLRPLNAGPATVVELAIRPATWNPLSGGAAMPEPVELPPVVRRSRVELSHSRPLTLVRNAQGDAPVGLVMRPLPIDPTVPLPLTLMPGETLQVEARLPDGGRLEARSTDGTALRVATDGGFSEALPVAAGPATIRVQNPHDRPLVGALRLVLDRPTPAESPLPVERLGALPVFPTLASARPAAVTLDRNREKTWRVVVAEPALYILESTGLLQTAGNLRTRTRLGFARDEASGVGRNFRVARYLGQGEYQLTVSTRGASRGRLGVQLVTTPLIDGGALKPDIPARRTVPAGRAVAYTFDIAERGRYRLRSIGRGHTFRCRLEDGDGWPITRPEVDCDTTRAFEPGRYRVIVLPSAVETKRQTRLEPVRETARFVGHGPHALPARQSVRHVWREPTAGDRTPDWWDFTLSAASPVQFTLSEEMVGELMRRDGETMTRIERIAGGALAIELEPGDYRLAVRCGRRNDHVPYTLEMRPERLMAGHDRWIRPPAEIPLAVGAEGLFEITSEGSIDVRARLLDAEGRSLAVADDRPDGWNFRIARRLTPGDYTLRVEALDGDRGRSRIAMHAPTGIDGEPLVFESARALVPDGVTHHLPLPALGDGPGAPPALLARVQSAQNVGVAIEAQTGDGWTTLAQDTGTDTWIAARPVAGANHRLRLWSLDQRGLPATVTAFAPRPVQPSEAEAARGVDAEPGRAPAAVIALPTLLPGVFAVRGPSDLLACVDRCAPVGERPLAVGDRGLVLVSGAGAVSARRVVVGAEPVALTVPGDRPVRLDLAKAGGPRWIEARSPIGRPGVRLAGAPMAVGRQSSAVYAAEGASAVELTSGDGSPLEVRVRAVSLDRPTNDTVKGGVDTELAPGTGRLFALPAGHGPRITLSTGLAAVVGDGVVWAADGPSSSAPGPEKQVLVLNPGTAPARFRLVTVAGATDYGRLTAERPIELTATARGELRIPVAGAEARLRLAGAVDFATLVDADGRIGPAAGADVRTGGTLVLQYRPGPVLAWLEPTDGSRAGPWGSAGEPGVTLDGNAELPLDGADLVARVKLGAPGMLHLRAAAPFAAVARPEDGAERVELRPAGGRIDIWLPTGAGTIHLRGLAGAPLWGAAEATVSRATTIGEGPGPEVLLAPGEARPFRFTIERKGPIGVGVRAAADRVEATLLDARGAPIGEGPVQMPSLEPGSYVLVLRLPADAAPVNARPALAGVEPPDDTPPAEVIRKYLRLSGHTPAVN